MSKITGIHTSGAPVGTVKSFSGSAAPAGTLLCDGAAISRIAYANLFSIIGTTYGSGDGSTTFNLPDYRAQFLRGAVPTALNTITGSGTPSSNNAIFTAHGINRTGFKVRVTSLGTLTGLSLNTDYYVIVVDANTLAFASSRANALTNTKLTIGGTNNAVITQYEDPDSSSRIAMNIGGNTGTSVGSIQDPKNLKHDHGITSWISNSGNFYSNSPQKSYDTTNATHHTFWNGYQSYNLNSSTNSDATTTVPIITTTDSNVTGESRPLNAYIQYCIAYK